MAKNKVLKELKYLDSFLNHYLEQNDSNLDDAQKNHDEWETAFVRGAISAIKNVQDVVEQEIAVIEGSSYNGYYE